jgi:threonine dehydrogenase-like Zn-dependent dehydrogenase
MKALCWHATHDVRYEEVPDPQILHPRDAIVRISSTAICGSDLHLYDGFVPTMERGDVLGHEFMGEVVEVGRANKALKAGDRVVVPFTISCGECFFCSKGLFSCCERTNPNADLAAKLWGHATAGCFGYSHLTGGFAGGQAQYVRVPYADVGPLKVDGGLKDEQVLFLGDIFPTGYMAAENCNIHRGDTIAVWGCGPVGQFAIRSAFMLGAERVIAIDRVPERLVLAAEAGAETVNFLEEEVYDRIQSATEGRGADSCIDAVGAEAHAGGAIDAVMDKVKTAAMLETDRAHALRQSVINCRNGGTVSIVGVYGGFIDKFPIGSAMNRGLTFRMAQCHVPRYMKPLLRRIEAGEIDPSFVVTHRLSLADGPGAYRTFRDKRDHCIKVVMSPN